MDAEFHAVTELLGMDARSLAEVLGVPVQSVRQMRADPDSTAYRPPPVGWERVIGKIARARALELLRVANELLRAE
jgi:hypothetical protein